MEERLNKFIASTGVCSRRKADEYIAGGHIKVNDIVITELGYRVVEKDVVKLDGIVLKKEKEKIYVALNKPVGYVSTAKEQFNRPCITSLVKSDVRLYPVGRLDMYSEGLILLTNDGDLVNKIIHPTKHVSKTYEVTFTSEITEGDLLHFERGVDIGGYITKEAKVKRLGKNVIELVIYEGKNRQIRKMSEALGYKVKRLKRTKIGQLTLDGLNCGDYIFLTDKDVKKVFET